MNFHSFRRWFITKAERAGVDGDLLAAIVGHRRSGLTLGRYSEGLEMEAAKAAVAKVRLPPLDGTPIVEARPLMPRRRQVASRWQAAVRQPMSRTPDGFRCKPSHVAARRGRRACSLAGPSAAWSKA
ncbi:protein of unknown function [Methylorubrum extorquens]|uniref:Tyr recombinase domain-containing protein n=1 Tax=Methylorubrum extorquens TaxID=408 RepID=A0A2N9AZB4_METEX|nr:protein of unknown function [Methylorubrum extorquens]